MDERRQHIVTTAVEHSAVRRHCEDLAKRGCEVTFLGVDAEGNLDLAEVEQAIRPDTAIVSVMWANNETGVLFPVEEIARITQKKGALFHTDAVQAVGKIPIKLADSAISFLSLGGTQTSWSERGRSALCERADALSPAAHRWQPGERTASGNGERGFHRGTRESGGARG